jgi:DNA-binding beta-propeller fold protein YncE/Leucine-rich repeat (LRR) protein
MVVYAESGAGKTSLMNAGVLPDLEEEGLEVIPFARVYGRIPERITRSEIPNLYVLNTLISWAGEESDAEQLAKMTVVDFLKGREHLKDKDGDVLPRVIVFDQFEELFTAYEERWKDRDDFFKQLQAALEADPMLRVVFVMREEHIAHLDPYVELIPDRLRTRFHLRRLGRDAALKAITWPLRGTERTFADEVAENLIEDLLKVHVQVGVDKTVEAVGEFVEPVQLQVVCESLWRSLPNGIKVIENSHLRTFGDTSQALSKFYEQSIKAASNGARISKGRLRKWFDKILITQAGTRGTVFRGRKKTGGIANKAVDILENSHLIRGELRAGARWYELTHDRFIEPIRYYNERRKQRQRLAIGGMSLFAVIAGVIAASIILIPQASSTTKYELTLIANPADIGTVSTVDDENKNNLFTENSLVKIEAESLNAEWAFLRWDGDVTDTSLSAATVYMDDDKIVTAIFEQIFTLSIAVSGDGTVKGSGTYLNDTSVEISATPYEGWEFLRWDGDVADINSSVTTITVDDDKTVAAVFQQMFTLSIAVSGSGSVTGSGTYPKDTPVEITAMPDQGWSFVNWDGEVSGVDSPTTIVIISDDKTVIAIFEQVFTLSITVNGSGTVTGSGTYPKDFPADVNAMPDQGWSFVNWDGDVAHPTSPTTTVYMDENKIISANFTETGVVLTGISMYLTTTTVRLNGVLEDLGGSDIIFVSFKWGTEQGNLTQETAKVEQSKIGQFSIYLSGLDPNTTYYYRAKAGDDYSNVVGDERQFTTRSIEESVIFYDDNFEEAIRDVLNKPDGDITIDEMAAIGSVNWGLSHQPQYDDLRIENLAGLEYCINLTELNLQSNDIDHLEFIHLENLNKLEDLNISFNHRIGGNIAQLIDIIHKDLPLLKSLSIADIGITDISEVITLTGLTHLYIQTNPLGGDITSIGNLDQLEVLRLGNCELTDIRPLTELSNNLRELDMTNRIWAPSFQNMIRDFSPIKQLVYLEQLFLDSLRIYNISFLESLTELEKLYLSNNYLDDSDIQIFSGLDLRKLWVLSLEWNDITDIKVIADLKEQGKLPALTLLYLGGNPLNDESKTTYASQLEALGVTVNLEPQVGYWWAPEEMPPDWYTGTLLTGNAPIEIAQDGINIWVVNKNDNTIMKFRISDGKPLGEPIQVGNEPVALEYDENNDCIWVANYQDNTVWKIRASDGEILRIIDVGNGPFYLEYDGTYIWVANKLGNSVTQIDASNGDIVDTYVVGNEPSSLVYDGTYIWVANYVDDNVMRIMISTGEVSDPFPVGDGPWALAYDDTNKWIWVANLNQVTVMKLSASNGEEVGHFPVGRVPRDLEYDPITNSIWVACEQDGTVEKYRAEKSSNSDGISPEIVYDGGKPYIGPGEPYTGPYDLEYDHTNQYIWVANISNGTVIRLDILDNIGMNTKNNEGQSFLNKLLIYPLMILIYLPESGRITRRQAGHKE